MHTKLTIYTIKYINLMCLEQSKSSDKTHHTFNSILQIFEATVHTGLALYKHNKLLSKNIC